MNITEILEDFNLKDNLCNRILVEDNIDHLKDQQLLYRLYSTYPNLYCAGRYSQKAQPLILNPPPRNLEVLKTSYDMYTYKMIHYFVLSSKNDFINMYLNDFLSSNTFPLSSLSRQHGELWYSNNEVSSPLVWILRTNHEYLTKLNTDYGF